MPQERQALSAQLTKTLLDLEKAITAQEGDRGRALAELHDVADALTGARDDLWNDVRLAAEDTVALAVNDVRESVRLVASRSVAEVSALLTNHSLRISLTKCPDGKPATYSE